MIEVDFFGPRTADNFQSLNRVLNAPRLRIGYLQLEHKDWKIVMGQDKMILAGVIALVLPIVGGALGHIPAIGTQLMAVAANLQIGVGAALASALAIL